MFDLDDSDKLKPCPFCGSDVEILECDEQPNEGGRVVQCLRCLACSRVQFGEFINAHLIEAWNRRTYDAQIATLTVRLAETQTQLIRANLEVLRHKEYLRDYVHRLDIWITETREKLGK